MRTTRPCQPQVWPVTTKTGSALSYTRLLRENRTYRFVWLSQVVSNAGDWFNTIAVLGLTLALTGSGLALGIVTICQMLPPFLMTPLAGVVAERYDRKRVMITADILRAGVALGFLLVETADDVWMLYLFMALLSGLQPFFDVTRTAALPSIARGKALLAANALSST
ncbi:MAG: MFS transporter, partial [Gemmatimonadetes bacterium]|nr:MFS transporter [Gemmatimonadota bacterium]